MEDTNFLNEEAIKAMLSKNSINRISKLLVLEKVDSTNSLIMRELKAGIGPVLICASEQQTAGRGRAGRAWYSPLSNNIYLSLSWEYSCEHHKLSGLSLAIGVVILNSLATFGYLDLELKWPNDILVKGAKLGGVLVEIIGDVSSGVSIVVGIGINVNMPSDQGKIIDRSWTDLSSINRQSPPSRNKLIAVIVDELLNLFSSFDSKGFAYWRDAWHARDAYLGKQVQIVRGTERLSGISRGVDEHGSLILELPDGLRYISAGDVSLREV